MIGIGESAIVAFCIFAVHVTVLGILTVTGLVALFRGNYSTLMWNWESPPFRSTGEDIFYGFAVAMLGVSGFESSSNYIEEQKPGVFPKTLRNMAIIVGIFNPLLAFLCIALVPFPGALPPAYRMSPSPVNVTAPIAAAPMANVTSPFFDLPIAAPSYYPHINMTGNMTTGGTRASFSFGLPLTLRDWC